MWQKNDDVYGILCCAVTRIFSDLAEQYLLIRRKGLLLLQDQKFSNILPSY